MPHEYLMKFGLPEQWALSVCRAGDFLWPATLGGAGGFAGVLGVDPGNLIRYALISLAIQLAIALLKSYFRERKENFDAAESRADKIEALYNKVIAVYERQSSAERAIHQMYRHSFFNQLNAIQGENKLLRAGIPPAEVPQVEVFYPDFSEQSLARQSGDNLGRPG